MISTDQEQIRFHVGANLKRGIEYVGGNLTVTNKNVYFKPHSLNLQKEELVIPIKSIKVINKANVMGILPNGVVIELHNGSHYKFLINFMDEQRIKIINYIDSMVA